MHISWPGSLGFLVAKYLNLHESTQRSNKLPAPSTQLPASSTQLPGLSSQHPAPGCQAQSEQNSWRASANYSAHHLKTTGSSQMRVIFLQGELKGQRKAREATRPAALKCNETRRDTIFDANCKSHGIWVFRLLLDIDSILDSIKKTTSWLQEDVIDEQISCWLYDMKFSIDLTR